MKIVYLYLYCSITLILYDLHYFIYELDYGEAKGANEAIETYGKTWDLSSPEKFYDYLCAMKQLDQIIS